MGSSSLAMSSNNLNLSNVQINFDLNSQKNLRVTIDTPHLLIRSVQTTDLDSYTALYGDKEVMCKFADGNTKSREDLQKRINEAWVKRWNTNDPYNGLAVFTKDTAEFVGHVVLGHGDLPGESEVAILTMKKFWNKGYGSEAMTALVRHYAPLTLEKGYLVDGKPLAIIRATARPDNQASCKILQKIGFVHQTTEEKYGAIRHHFSLAMEALNPIPAPFIPAPILASTTANVNSSMKLRSGTIVKYRADLAQGHYYSSRAKYC